MSAHAIPVNKPQLDALLTEAEMADVLNVSTRHVCNLRAKRLIPYVRLGASIRYDRAQVAEAIDRLTVRPR